MNMLADPGALEVGESKSRTLEVEYTLPPPKFTSPRDAGAYLEHLSTYTELVWALRESGHADLARSLEDDIFILMSVVSTYLQTGEQPDEIVDLTSDHLAEFLVALPAAAKVDLGTTPLEHADRAMELLVHATRRAIADSVAGRKSTSLRVMTDG